MNKVSLMGRLTKDPEYRGTATTFLLAVDRRFQKTGEEKQADFISVVAFGKTAELVQKYFTKGKQIAISGRIQAGTYQKNNGEKRYSMEVVAEEIYFIGKKENTEERTPENIYETVDINAIELPWDDVMV